MDSNNRYAMSDVALLKSVGETVQQLRVRENKTQQQIADAAGINRSTLVQLENGKGANLLTLIQVLRVLEQLHLLPLFESPQTLSPLQLAKLEHKKRRRAHAIASPPSTTDWE